MVVPGCHCADPLVGPGGENQKLVPAVSGAVTFAPPTAFGLSLDPSGERMYSDDAVAGAHTFRFWPARDRDGSVLPDTWIVGMDIGSTPSSFTTKNWDFQDFKWVLSNARPA